MMGCLKRFRQDESGATAIEYALIASLIAMAIVVSVTAVGLEVVSLYQAVVDGFDAANS